jgi:ADP-L-glycero-D-manno-heptose 6-epimerase
MEQNLRKVLLTGSKGFIGQNIKIELIKQGFDVSEINEDIFLSKGWKVGLLNQLIRIKPEVIFHVGACSDTLEKDVNYMMVLNFEFTKLLVDWSLQNDSKLIYSSSAASYGENNLHPSNLYGWSKYVAEQYVISNNGIGLRYFNVYGPKEEHKGKMASLAYQSYVKNMNGEECKLFPKKPTRDFVYVKDIISANMFAFNNYFNLNKKYYDVGSGESRSFEDVLDNLNIPYTYHDEKMIPQGYQFFTCSDKDKWMTEWKPEYNLEKGLKDYKNYLELSINK